MRTGGKRGMIWLNIVINLTGIFEYVASFTLPCFPYVYVLDVKPKLPFVWYSYVSLLRLAPMKPLVIVHNVLEALKGHLELQIT